MTRHRPLLHGPLALCCRSRCQIQPFPLTYDRKITVVARMRLRELLQQASRVLARQLCLREYVGDFRIVHRHDLGDLDARRHMCPHIQHRQVDHIL